ncbi:MAG TPA: efflux RND transporter periplasmic adaptor subunit [Hellea balneolensis]|uniref:Efflux RND transporter periplasmic adaptor subunit n=1 Tax=Hellea balneolensis TaxID=287478 RepID=A0A7C5R0W5_9PROT|nr:efflux RND transporter periplasmic adaptor subunit [Hellea balneolensis]
MKPKKTLLVIMAMTGTLLTGQISQAQQPNRLVVSEQIVTDYRPVVARLESSDTITARARISGVVTTLNIDEGSLVKKGDVLARIQDESIGPQLAALDAKISGIENQLSQLIEDLNRAEKLHKEGFFPTSKLDQARTQVEVTKKALSGAKSERNTLISVRTKGVVRAASDGRVTAVNVVKGSVVSPGEIIARLATLDGVVRLALPERHAGQIREGETLSLRLPARGGEVHQAVISKIYPELRGGAVIADAIVDGGLSALVGERVDVLVPVGERRALRIPKSFIKTRFGIDFVKVHVGEHVIEAPVTLANPIADADGYVEVLSGLHTGDEVEKP